MVRSRRDPRSTRCSYLQRSAACLLLLVVPGCSKSVTPGECAKLLDRYTELLLRSDRKDLAAEDRIKLREQARLEAAQDPSFRKCGQRVSRRQFECAMKAVSVDEMERCLI